MVQSYYLREHGVQDHQNCSQEFINGLEYSQVAGLIIGMIALGFSVDRIGRRLGSILTASVMLIGNPAPCNVSHLHTASTSLSCILIFIPNLHTTSSCSYCILILPLMVGGFFHTTKKVW